MQQYLAIVRYESHCKPHSVNLIDMSEFRYNPQKALCVHQTLSLLEGRVWQRHYVVMEDFYYRFRYDHIHVYIIKCPDRRGVLIVDAIRVLEGFH